MARKEQRNHDKKKRPFTRKQVQFSTTTSVVKAEPKAIKSPLSSHQLIGKRPWSHLVEIQPGRTHLGQANASARKRHQRQLRLAEMAAEAAEAKELGLTVAQLRARRAQEAEEKKYREEKTEYLRQCKE